MKTVDCLKNLNNKLDNLTCKLETHICGSCSNACGCSKDSYRYTVCVENNYCFYERVELLCAENCTLNNPSVTPQAPCQLPLHKGALDTLVCTIGNKRSSFTLDQKHPLIA